MGAHAKIQKRKHTCHFGGKYIKATNTGEVGVRSEGSRRGGQGEVGAALKERARGLGWSKGKGFSVALLRNLIGFVIEMIRSVFSEFDCGCREEDGLVKGKQLEAGRLISRFCRVGRDEEGKGSHWKV